MFYFQSVDEENDSRMYHNESDHEVSDNDMIVFVNNDRNKEIKWRYPNIKHCMTRRCNKKFPTRAMAIEHYREAHANNFGFCEICVKPFHLHNIAKHRGPHKPQPESTNNASQVDLCFLFFFFEILL